MPTPSETKIRIKNQILKILEQKDLELNMLTSSLALQYGWKKETIEKIVMMLRDIGKIDIAGDEVSLARKSI